MERREEGREGKKLIKERKRERERGEGNIFIVIVHTDSKLKIEEQFK